MINENNIIRKFEDIWTSFKKDELQGCIYRQYCTHRSYERYLASLKFFNELAIENNDKILELGAWPYHFTLILKKLNFDITTIDLKISEGHTAWLQKKDIISFACDIEKDRFPFENGNFRYVFFLETLEHLYHNPLITFLEINRVLKKGGALFISTPNKDSLRRRISAFLSMNNGTGESPFQLYRHISLGGRPGHFRLYNRCEMEEFLINAGFVIEKVSFLNFSEETDRDDKETALSPCKNTRKRIFKKRNYFKAGLATSLDLLMRLKSDYREMIFIWARKKEDRNLMDLR